MLWDIEKKYRTEILYYLRKLVMERYYGLKK